LVTNRTPTSKTLYTLYRLFVAKLCDALNKFRTVKIAYRSKNFGLNLRFITAAKNKGFFKNL
jgi:hypothetical protein